MHFLIWITHMIYAEAIQIRSCTSHARRAYRVRCGGAQSCRFPLAAAAALLGVTGQPESNFGRMFLRSWSRGDGSRRLRRRRRCRVALIITGGRFRSRSYLSTAFIVRGWVITSVRHRDTGVERVFRPASGMGAHR